MLSPTLTANPERERVELLILAAGLAAIATFFAVFLSGRIFPAVLAMAGVCALVGYLFYRRVGHDVYLVFALISLAVGHIVSPIIVFVTYVFGIGLVGSLLRMVGMNRLKRNFAECRAAPTMFIDATTANHESFRRQS